MLKSRVRRAERALPRRLPEALANVPLREWTDAELTAGYRHLATPDALDILDNVLDGGIAEMSDDEVVEACAAAGIIIMEDKEDDCRK